MFDDDDPYREPVDLSGLTSMDFLVGFALPIALLSAAFAILIDGRLTRASYTSGFASVFAGIFAAIAVTMPLYALLKPLLGAKFELTNQMAWSIWIGLGAVFAAFMENRKSRSK